MSNTSTLPVNFFKSAEEAWFWYCKCQLAKEEKHPRQANTFKASRPCGLDDIYICVVKLSLAGKLKKRHINTLVKFGNAQIPPDPRVEEEVLYAIWWDEAMDKLESLMIKKGFICTKIKSIS